MNCPKCKGPLVYPDGLEGEAVCERCGLVVSPAQTGPSFSEWTPTRLSAWSRQDSETLRKWLTTLRTVSAQLNLPSTPYNEEAARIIRQKSQFLFRSQRFGKNKREAVAALLYLILKEYEVMRPLKEICGKLSLEPALVTKYAWEMRKMTNLKKIFTPIDYLRKYGSTLAADKELIKTAEKLLTTIKKQITGNPISLAAGAVYLICKNNKTRISKEQIGHAFQISSRTVYTNAHRISRTISQKYLNVRPTGQ